jgi:hypothetical protein
VSVWDSLKIVLVGLLDEQPGALTSYPDPRVDADRRPPFHIGLAPWASSAAGELHDRFGTDVELMVGAQSYPSGGDQHLAWREGDTTPVVDPSRIGIELGGPLSVRTGHTEHHELLLTNRTESALAISTNGQVTAVVVDPGNNRVIGGFAGAQEIPLVVFRILPGATTRIPLLVGTASFDRALGYAVPPGDWLIRATLVVDGDQMSTPALPLTVID